MILWLLACSTETVAVQAMVHNPLQRIDRSIDRTPIEARIAQRLEAGGYVYLRSDDGVWFVGLAKPVQVGQTVTIRPMGRAEGFHSGRLDRTFDTLIFAVFEGAG